MTDTATTASVTDAPLRSVVAPSGGAGAGLEAEQQAGTSLAQQNAKDQEEARDKRSRETLNARQILSDRIAATETEQAQRAEQIRGMVQDRMPPPGPGLPEIDQVAIIATMDPNNEVLNPDMSKLGARLNKPAGARVPAPVLPQDTIQTQFASKPPTDAHAQEGAEVAKGLDVYPPPGSQPTVELTPEEEQKYGGQRQIGGPAPTQYPATGYDPNLPR